MKFQITLQELRRISPTALDQTCRATRGALGTVEWKMGLCLLAWSRRPELRDMGYSSAYDYGERALNLCGRKVSELLGAARALEHLPKLSEALRTGTIGWSKVRVLHGLATPETEELWIDFASKHRSEEVARKVTLSPTEWKQHRALRASLKQQPIASESAVEKILLDNDHSPKSDACPKRTNPSPPPAPKTIRLVANLTPDEYALYEQAENRIRAKSQRRLSRAKVITKMAEQILSHGSAIAVLESFVLLNSLLRGFPTRSESRGVAGPHER